MPHVSALLTDYEIDVLILCESGATVVDVLKALNPTGQTAQWNFCPSYTAAHPSTNLMLFVKGLMSFVTPLLDIKHLTVRRVVFPSKEPFLLALVHLPSLMHANANDQAAVASEIASDIQEIEDEEGHSRTIMVGDFNMNPFSLGLVSARSLNAVMTRGIAAKEHRIKYDRSYRYFFNPMWNFFNDGENDIPGTYFYGPQSFESIHWHIFDQVLVRPRLMKFLLTQDIEIITASQCGSLLKNKKPFPSDHLPLKFRITFPTL